MLISEQNLDFWIKNNYNVLFEGKHGVGKTSIIKSAFERHNLKWKYFSASTMDPWVDFIGIPKEVTAADGKIYLDLIRPKEFQDDEVEAIFFDEFNRSHKKIKNAVMELIQFKSINGKKFNNLKMIWAAINPEDDEDNTYDVEPLDPAQLDRFHIKFNVPYLPDVSYFREKYGTDIADTTVTWWKELTDLQKNLVSPRRLDYVLDIYKNKGDIRHALNKEVNVNKLLLELANGSFSKRLKEYITSKQEDECKKFLSVENHFAACSDFITKNSAYYGFLLPLIHEEKLIVLLNKSSIVKKYVFEKYDLFSEVINNIAKSGSSKISKEAKAAVTKAKSYANFNGKNKLVHYTKTKLDAFSKELVVIDNRGWTNLVGKINAYNTIKNTISKDLDEATAKHVLKLLVDIISQSHKKTLNSRMGSILHMVNHVCTWFESNNIPVPITENSLEKIIIKYPSFTIFNQDPSVKNNLAKKPLLNYYKNKGDIIYFEEGDEVEDYENDDEEVEDFSF